MRLRAAVCGSIVVATMSACTVYTTSAEVDGGGTSSSGAVASSGTPSASSGAAASSSGGSSGGSASSSGSSNGGASGGTSSSSSSGSSGGPLDAFEQELLDGFNQVRAVAIPTPEPALPVLVWDDAAEQASREFATQCSPGAAPSGMLSGNGTTPLSAANLVQLATSERQYYSYASNACDPAAEGGCVFYKILLQRSVTKVGCAVATCPTRDRFACVFTTVTDPAARPY